jgi:hypothetical protein
MKKQKQKGYWEKKTERFSNGSKAKSRAKHLRSYEHIQHVIVDKHNEDYVVTYSVAKWYIEEINRAGIII